MDNILSGSRTFQTEVIELAKVAFLLTCI